MEITKTIKKVMIDKDIQVGELADKYVISRQNFSRILNAGDRNKIETLIKIADLLDCNVEITLIDRELRIGTQLVPPVQDSLLL